MVTSALLTLWLAATTMAPLSVQAGVSATFDMPVAPTLNEPVRVTMRIRNLLNEPVKFDLGRDRTQNLTLVVRGPDGRLHTETIPLQEGIARVGRIELAPQREYIQPLVLNDWMAFDRPGPYQLEIRFTAPFVTASGPVAGPPSETLTIEIRPRDVAVLEHTYWELVDAYLNAVGEQRWYAAQALRHLTDPVAVPMLRRILDSTKTDDYIYIVLDTLRKIGTPDAVAVLQEVAASGSAERAAIAKSALVRLRLGR
jgi:hypothetical protein